MPTYNYKCEDCKQAYCVIHSINDKHSKCNHCDSSNIHKTISLFAAKTESGLDSSFRNYQEQFSKDMERFQKDDNFAANITGYDDPGSVERTKKVMEEQKKKQQEALNNFKGNKK